MTRSELVRKLDFALLCYGFFEAPHFRREVFHGINEHLRVFYPGMDGLSCGKGGYERLADLIRKMSEAKSGPINDVILIGMFFWELAVLQNIICYCHFHIDGDLMEEYVNIIQNLKRLVGASKIEVPADSKKIEEFRKAVDDIQPKANFNFRNYFELTDLINFICTCGFMDYRIRRFLAKCRSFYERMMEDFSWRMEICDIKKSYDSDPVAYIKAALA